MARDGTVFEARIWRVASVRFTSPSHDALASEGLESSRSPHHVNTSYVEAPPPAGSTPPLDGHLLDTSYGIHFGSTPPWRFWDTMQQIQQIHKLRLAVSLLFVCLTMFTTFYLMSETL